MLVESKPAELLSDHATDRKSSWPRTEAKLCSDFPLWREKLVRRHQNAPSSEPDPATEANKALLGRRAECVLQSPQPRAGLPREEVVDGSVGRHFGEEENGEGSTDASTIREACSP
jgi:hypothetical protein